MGTITAATVSALTDSYAKSLVDLQTTFVTGTALSASTIVAGVSSAAPSTLSRVLAIDDAEQELALLPAASQVAAKLGNRLDSFTQLMTFFPDYALFCDALDQQTGGLVTFLTANSLQVHGYFADAFNWYAANASGSLGLRAPGKAPNPIPAGATFIPSSSQQLCNFTGGSPNNFSVDSPIDGTRYAPAELFLKVLFGSGSPASYTVYSVTYIPSAGGTPLAIAVTPGSSTTGNEVDLGVAGLSITSVVTTTPGADTANQYAIVVHPPRTVIY